MTGKAAKQAILDLLLEEFPAARELGRRAQVRLAEVYALEGRVGVERHLSSSSASDDELPHLFVKRRDGPIRCDHCGLGRTCKQLDGYLAERRAS